MQNEINFGTLASLYFLARIQLILGLMLHTGSEFQIQQYQPTHTGIQTQKF